MDTVTDMDMLMVTHMKVMNMEDRVSPGTIFSQATLPTFGSPHLKVLKWEETSLVGYIGRSLFSAYTIPFFTYRAFLRRRNRAQREEEKGGRGIEEEERGSTRPKMGQ